MNDPAANYKLRIDSGEMPGETAIFILFIYYSIDIQNIIYYTVNVKKGNSPDSLTSMNTCLAHARHTAVSDRLIVPGKDDNDMKNAKLFSILSISLILAGCSRPAPTNAATPSASAASTSAPVVSAEPSVSAEASATPEATIEASAEPESTAVSASPSASPSATPEASAPAEDATAASSEDTATVTDDGDDCGWISDPSMKDGGWCSLHPEWYGMPANSSNSNASASQPAATASYGSITFYNQLDGRWRNQKVGDATFGPHGCCPTALAMMLSRRGIAMTPPEVGWMLNSWGIFGNSANGFLGTRSDAWMQVADHYGWAWSELYTGDDLYNALAAGADVGLALNYGGAGHTVYVHGVDAYGNTTVYDGNSGGPYTKSVYTLMSQIYDPYTVGGAAVAVYEPGSVPAEVAASYDDTPVAEPGTIVCYNENGEQVTCDF